MSRADRELRRHVDALLKDRRPGRARSGDDVPAMQMAARLHAEHPGSAEPSPEFVDALARRLRREQDATDVRLPQRRSFLAAAGAAAAAGVGAGFGISRLLEPAQTGSRDGSQEPVVPADGAWVAVSTTAAATPGSITRFSAGGVEGFLLNVDGSLRALSAACTDQGCILTADVAQRQLVCPCHWATFQLDGRPTPTNSYTHKVTPLPTISVRVNGAHVEVLVPKTA